MIYLKWGKFNVHELTATYQELVKVFGTGTKNFDSSKQFAQWNVETTEGEVEIYDYGYVDHSGTDEDVELQDITLWHVQGDKKAIQEMLQTLRDANR
jgi:hypothetical protein